MRLILVFLAVFSLRADVRDCTCDLNIPAVRASSMCALCVAAENQPRFEVVFLLKDADPAKPNGWLAVTTGRHEGANPLLKMAEAERIAFWSLAVQKAFDLWGDGWAIAMNGAMTETQCHAHAHIGKFLGEKATDHGAYIDGIEDLPVLFDARGLWFHPSGGRLHVHVGVEDAESVLLK